MIYIKSNGNMGNQLFQYAFGYSTARRLKTSFCISHWRNLENFTLGGDTPLANATRKTTFKLKSIFRRPEPHDWQEYNEARYTSPEVILGQLTDHGVYRGYFQSHRYFEGVEEEIKTLFQPQAALVEHFHNTYSDYLTGKPLAILHLRGKDYAGWSDVQLPQTYYDNCLARVKDPDVYRWIALTDDVEFARTLIPPTWKVECVSGSVLDDFQLMQRAKIHIMANSSFSWWAAYLNRDPHARIIGPRYWFGHKAEFQYEAPEGIMNPQWEWVNVHTPE